MPPSDSTLLRDFAERRSEAAFADLVRRHIDLVHSAATRITGDRHLAEDVAQAVFVALAHQAAHVVGKLDRGMPLSAWLHLTTRNLAAKVVRSETRRRTREQASSVMPSDSVSSNSDRSDWDRIAHHLDGSLGELSESDRRVVVLRFFEGKTAREIAALLGIAEDAAQKRVLRAVDRLRSHLDRHAPGMASTTLAALLGTWSVQKAPEALAMTVTQGALQGLGAAAPAGLAAACRETFAALMTTKNQAIATGAVLTVLALPIGYQVRAIHEARQRPLPVPTRTLESSVPRVPSLETAPATPGTDTARDDDEIARLRARADDLRARIAARKAMPPLAPPIRPAAAGPLLLRPGQTVPMTNLVAAGNDSPEAAAQTLLAHMRDGDLDATLGLLLLSPDDRAETEAAVLGDPTAREALVQRMRSEVAAILTVELAGIEALSDRRSLVTLRRVTSTGTTNELKMTFGRTPTGWKQVH